MKKKLYYLKKIGAIILTVASIAVACLPMSSSAVAESSSYRRETTVGVANIVRRARQMTEIKWTPKKDIEGWNGGVVYRAGTEYTGIPYGQPVYASYVPWSTDLDGFLEAVEDTNSKMYTSYSTYNCKAPYYSTDCSAFVSWAWELPGRQTTWSLSSFSTLISDSSYSEAQVGDALNKAGVHAVLITDITYDRDGNINAIEISEAAVNRRTNYCTQVRWYGDGYLSSLEDFTAEYFNSGYGLYRCNSRDYVSYTHSCASPLEGDVCYTCGYGAFVKEKVYGQLNLISDAAVYKLPSFESEVTGRKIKGANLIFESYASVEESSGWYEIEDGWISAECVGITAYRSSLSLSEMSFPSTTLSSGSFFPVAGEMSSINPISRIYAAIYLRSDPDVPVQEFTLEPKNTYSYSLEGSPVDYAMKFNRLKDGDYTIRLTVTERASCSASEAVREFTLSYESDFSVKVPLPSGEFYKGIDVSHYQGEIDWETVSREIDFAIIRCGFGGDILSQDDRMWERNASECERLSIPYGVYIYSYALNEDDARSEAAHVLRLLEGHSPTLPVFLDLEDPGTVATLSNAEILRNAEIFCDIIADAGYSVGIYASHDWWDTRLSDATYDNWQRWVARWYAPASGYEGNSVAWQYTDSGSVAGIVGNVDLDFWFGPLVPVCYHSYKSEVISKTTCAMQGEIRHTCFLCGHTYTETVPTLPHEYKAEIFEPTCEERGYTQFECMICRDTYIGDEKDAVSHSYVDGKCVYCDSPAPDSNNVSITVGSTDAEVGETVVIPVTVTKNSGFSSFTLTVSYDPSALSLVQIENGDMIDSLESVTFEPNIVENSVHFTGNGDISSEGTLFYMTFTVLQGASGSSCKIGLSVKDGLAGNFINSDGKSLDAVFHNGTVNVAVSTDPCERFTDMDRDAWYHDAVDFVLRHGYMNGKPNDRFEPNGKMTRAQLVQVIYNLDGAEAPEYSETFTDVMEDDWFADAVLWAAENSVVGGYPDGSFKPDDEITREEMAVIIYRYLLSRGESTETKADISTFPDASDVSDWAYEAFSWANACGVINGTKKDDRVILAPKGTATRAQVAQVFCNYFNK